jgi:hypothetical protein
MQARLFRWLVRLLFSRVITDPVCRVRDYRRQVAPHIKVSAALGCPTWRPPFRRR